MNCPLKKIVFYDETLMRAWTICLISVQCANEASPYVHLISCEGNKISYTDGVCHTVIYQAGGSFSVQVAVPVFGNPV